MLSAGVFRLESTIHTSGNAAITAIAMISSRISPSAARGFGPRKRVEPSRMSALLLLPCHREYQHDDHDQREHQHDRHRRAQAALRALDADTANVKRQHICGV